MLSPDEILRLERLDKETLWHPFTPMQPWCEKEHHPLIIERGEGAWLWDAQGRRYLDGNSSIWTNTLGHGHPRLTKALREQSGNICHSSFLGFTNRPAIELAAELVRVAPGPELRRVFFSDNGSTAVEVAIRQALQWHQLSGDSGRRVILAFDQAYHGDTLGAASLGGIPLFRGFAKGCGYDVVTLSSASELDELEAGLIRTVAAVIVEPLVQGAAGIRLWPPGMLRNLRSWCDRHGAFLVLDEIMTGFGRTGRMFACEHEGVAPDFLCLAKGLTGGCLPLAATLTTTRVFDAFLGHPSEGKTFYYGHSYCGNPLAAAVALAHLRAWEEEDVAAGLPEKVRLFQEALAPLSGHARVREIRQCGLIAGIEICRTREPWEAYPAEDFTGARVCLAAREHGLLTRPVLDTVIFMPPLCCGEAEYGHGVRAITAVLDDLE